jgi:hypothetical protein
MVDYKFLDQLVEQNLTLIPMVAEKISDIN